MSPTPFQRSQGLEWDVASRAVPGQKQSGDLQLVRPRRDGMLAAVVDGLGHGDEASVAAKRAIEVLEQHVDESVIGLMRRCDGALRTTRGAVMTLVSFNMVEHTVAMLGVGNVETVLLRANPAANPSRESVLLRGGLVGFQLPALHASVLPVFPGDVMIFATDGVRDGFTEGVNLGDPLPQLVGKIMTRHFRGTDDALVLAIRYLGKPDG